MRLTLKKETLAALDPEDLIQVRGAGTAIMCLTVFFPCDITETIVIQRPTDRCPTSICTQP